MVLVLSDAHSGPSRSQGHSVDKVLRIRLKQSSAPARGSPGADPNCTVLEHFQPEPGCTHGNAPSSGREKPAAYLGKPRAWTAHQPAQLLRPRPPTWGPSRRRQQQHCNRNRPLLPQQGTRATWLACGSWLIPPILSPSLPPLFFSSPHPLLLNKGTEVTILGKSRPV